MESQNLSFSIDTQTVDASAAHSIDRQTKLQFTQRNKMQKIYLFFGLSNAVVRINFSNQVLGVNVFFTFLLLLLSIITSFEAKIYIPVRPIHFWAANRDYAL